MFEVDLEKCSLCGEFSIESIYEDGVFSYRVKRCKCNSLFPNIDKAVEEIKKKLKKKYICKECRKPVTVRWMGKKARIDECMCSVARTDLKNIIRSQICEAIN